MLVKKDVKIVTPVSEPTPAEDPNLVDIRDKEKHLLFRYNSLTDEVEIKSRGKLYKVNIPELRFTVKRNVLSSDPVTEWHLEPIEITREATGQAEVVVPTTTTILPVETPENQSGRDSVEQAACQAGTEA